MSLAEMHSVPWLATYIWMLDFKWEQKNFVLLLLLCCSIISCICIPPVLALLCPVVQMRTKVPQCLQKLTSFWNIITGPHVLGCNSRGFLTDVLFKRYEAKKKQLSWSLDWILVAASTMSGQNSHFLFLERMWLLSYLEISKRFSYPSKATPKGDSKKTHLLEFGTFLFTPVSVQARQNWSKETSRKQQNAINHLDTGSS